MKKLFILCIASILVCCAFGSSTAIDKNEKAGDQLSHVVEDELDQSQDVQLYELAMPIGRLMFPEIVYNFYIGQSFIPSKGILTRAELFIGKNGSTTYPLTVGIRDDLTQENLVETLLEPEDVPTEVYDWVEIDFEDLWVTPGQTYYIVCYTENVTDNWYAWGANNDSESYPDGCAWISTDEGDSWGNESTNPYSPDVVRKQPLNPQPLMDDNITWDMCFKTYGIETTELEIEMNPSIIGASAILRNIGDVPAYEVEWETHTTGGFLGAINTTTEGSSPQLDPGNEIEFSFGSFFGLGPIEITMTARAYNAPEVSTTANGFIIFFFIIMR